MLDVHQDVVGTAVCGEGVPPWFSDLATPGKVGKPLEPLPGPPQSCSHGPGRYSFEVHVHTCLCECSWTFDLAPGFKHLFNTSDGLCGTNDTNSWAIHAGKVDYNTRNPCCLRFNGGGESWSRLAFTWQATLKPTPTGSCLVLSRRAHGRHRKQCTTCSGQSKGELFMRGTSICWRRPPLIALLLPF